MFILKGMQEWTEQSDVPELENVIKQKAKKNIAARVVCRNDSTPANFSPIFGGMEMLIF